MAPKGGELHHAIAADLMCGNDAHAELGQIIAGQRPERTNDAEISIFDATGTGLQDAAGAAAYERAIAGGAEFIGAQRIGTGHSLVIF